MTLSVGIVIPTLNASAFLPNLLSSLETSASNYPSLWVHFQDGGSTDDTMALVTNWCESASEAPNIVTTWDVEKDRGPAQALNRGFTVVDTDILTWIGSDDLLMPHGPQLAAGFFTAHPDQHWITGLRSQVDEEGNFLRLGFPRQIAPAPSGFSQKQLSRGLHGSHWRGFVQQEGTFWTRHAWESIGGYLNDDLSLAFDFELWCRLARYFPLVQVLKPLGAFRKRRGQLSAARGAYMKEVRAVRTGLRRKGFARFPGHSQPLKRGLYATQHQGIWHLREFSSGAYLSERLRSLTGAIYPRREGTGSSPVE